MAHFRYPQVLQKLKEEEKEKEGHLFTKRGKKNPTNPTQLFMI